jgi:hypothetical protein
MSSMVTQTAVLVYGSRIVGRQLPIVVIIQPDQAAQRNRARRVMGMPVSVAVGMLVTVQGSRAAPEMVGVIPFTASK